MNNLPYYPPKTPTRRPVRGSHLTPSSTPFVTPSKTPERRCLTGHPRAIHFSPSTKRTPRHPATAPCVPRAHRSASRNGVSTPSTVGEEDRFIPSRRHTNLELCRRALLSGDKKRQRNQQSPQSPKANATQETPLQKEFKRRMLSSLCNVPLTKLNEDAEPTGLLSFRGSRTEPRPTRVTSGGTQDSSVSSGSTVLDNPFSHDLLRTMKLGESSTGGSSVVEDLSVAKKVLRKVPGAPFRILDAPDIVDDYYLNLISWSKDNILAVALAQSVYLWNASTGEINHLVTLEASHDYVTSVSWCSMPGFTKCIAVGTNSHAVHLFDAQRLEKIRTLSGHSGRVSSLAWNQNWISSGSRDSVIMNHDIRANPVVAKYRGHQQEVCGLKWNDDGSCLASGGNENYLCLWDAAMSGQGTLGARRGGRQLSDQTPRIILKKHRAAVKALDWCPFHRGLLASGGGTSDRTIKFWNSSSGAMLNSVDTGSQVCSIIWSKHQRELCSSHGYSENQLILWKYPTMDRIKELPGHTARVLNMEMSPDGTSVVSAAADETLRFWNVFGSSSSYRRSGSGMPLVGDVSFGAPVIR